MIGPYATVGPENRTTASRRQCSKSYSTPMTNRISFVILAALLLAGCQLSPSVEGRFAALGNTLFLQCYGEKGKGPTVLLEHGLGDRASSAAWDRVAPRVAAFAFVCRYDRAGAGQSDPPAQQDRDGANLTAELYTLLDVANIPEPYVLVGTLLWRVPGALICQRLPSRGRRNYFCR